MSSKVIITCAVTGSVHCPSMSPYLPISPDEIAEAAVEAAEAGAAILHLHARMPEDGRPTQDPEMFARFLPRIKQQTDAVVNITTGGGLHMSFDERLAPARRFKPELVSVNMGSMNFSFADLADKYEWKFDWERPYLAASKGAIYPNTFEQIEQLINFGNENGTRFEFECYDIGHLHSVAHFADRGLIKPPFFIQGVFGILGGIGADPDNLIHMRRMADRLFGTDYHFSVIGAGRHQMQFATMSVLLGGNVRVGLEDSLFIGRGELAKSNAEQVKKIRTII